MNTISPSSPAFADVLPHPVKTILTMPEFTATCAANTHLIQRKVDGCLARREVAGAVLLGQLVTTRSGAFLTIEDRGMIERYGSFFAAFTVESAHGEPVLNRSTRERWGILCSYVPHFPPDVVLVEQSSIPLVLTDEEGYVAHDWDAPWGSMLCVKQEQIYDCTVVAIGGTQSAEVMVEQTGATCRVKLGGGKIDQCRVGSKIRVGGMGLTDDGKIRQPTACRAWLKQF